MEQRLMFRLKEGGTFHTASLAVRYSLSLYHHFISVVIYHHGTQTEGGHYTTDILHSGVWTHFDDDVVEPTTEAQVLAETKDDQTAYMVFYIQKHLLEGH